MKTAAVQDAVKEGPKTITRPLKHGLKIGDVVHKEFEMRESSTDDLFDAEDEASTDTPLKFNGALMCRQLVRIGEFRGPFSLDIIRKLKPVDYQALRRAQLELERLGEAVSGDGEVSTTPSS